MRTLRSLRIALVLLGALALAAGCGRRVDPRAQEAYDMVVQNRVDEAIAFVNAILADEPDNAEIRNVLGLALYKAGDAEGAIEQYLQALEDDPKIPEIHFNLGNAYRLLGRTDEAEKQFEEAVRLEDKFVLAYDNLGILYRDSGRTEEAAAAFRRAADLDDQFYPAFLELGLLQAQAGDQEGAISSFTRVLELVPTYKEVRVHLGNAYLRSGRAGAAQLAENEFRAAVGIDPDYVQGLYSLGVALATQERRDEAVEAFTKVYRLTEDDPGTAVRKQVEAYFEKIGQPLPSADEDGASG